MISGEALLDLAKRGVKHAQHAGADQAEVCVDAVRNAAVELQKDDIHTAITSEEMSFGVRVVKQGSIGFAAVNGLEHLEQAAEEAVAMARAAPPDEHNGLGPAADPVPLQLPLDAQIERVTISELVKLAAELISRLKRIDPRIRVDWGGVSATPSVRAIASSQGVAVHESRTACRAGLLAMAVDGDDVGSFDYDSHVTQRWQELSAGIDALLPRLAASCLGALGARKGETFQGTVVFSPEVAHGLLQELTQVLSAKAVRLGHCPLGDKVGQAVASACLSVSDDARWPDGILSAAFDREGTPTRTTAILERGVLSGFLYDVYEARRAGVQPTGHARGSATRPPSIGPAQLVVAPGDIPLETLLAEPERAVLVNRFSGSSNPISGEFSGVVKNGFLLKRGERIPLRETLIAGNLYDVLQRVSGVSAERRNLHGSAIVPALRIEGVSITAG